MLILPKRGDFLYKYERYDRIMGRNKGTGQVGRPKKWPDLVKNVQINVRMTDEDKRFFEMMKEKTGLSGSVLIMSALRFYWHNLCKKVVTRPLS